MFVIAFTLEAFIARLVMLWTPESTWLLEGDRQYLTASYWVIFLALALPTSCAIGIVIVAEPKPRVYLINFTKKLLKQNY